MRKIILILAVVFFTGVLSAENLNINSNCNKNFAEIYGNRISDEQNKINSAVEVYINQLPLSQKISQLFLINVEGNTTYYPVEKTQKIKACAEEQGSLVPGGILLFSYNIGESPEQLMNYLNSVKKYCQENNICPPYISIDQEGGLVNRLYPITSYLPSNQKVAQKLTLEQAEQLYSLQAQQMNLLGINMNLAPVCESLLDSNKEFLTSRSFGSVPQTILYSYKAVYAYEKNNVAAVLKHFPGNTNTDPHSGLPEIKVSPDYAYKNFLLPFAFVLSASPTAVLMSHARTSFLDSKTPACLSEKWVKNILIDSLQFDGLVISDDIFMGALTSNGFDNKTAAIKTIESGVNVIMISEKTYGIIAQTLIDQCQTDSEFSEKINESVKKIITYKLKTGILCAEKNNEGTYFIKATAAKNESDIHQDLQKFYSVKKEGDDFYNFNFKK